MTQDEIIEIAKAANIYKEIGGLNLTNCAEILSV